jgi:activator of 2-hydroxyglutaryl-CoA dehydratase
MSKNTEEYHAKLSSKMAGSSDEDEEGMGGSSWEKMQIKKAGITGTGRQLVMTDISFDKAVKKIFVRYKWT